MNLIFGFCRPWVSAQGLPLWIHKCSIWYILWDRIGVLKYSAGDISIIFSLLFRLRRRLRKKVEKYGGDYSLDTKMIKWSIVSRVWERGVGNTQFPCTRFRDFNCDFVISTVISWFIQWFWITVISDFYSHSPQNSIISLHSYDFTTDFWFQYTDFWFQYKFLISI